MIQWVVWMLAGCAMRSPCAILSTRNRDIVGEDSVGHVFVCDCQSSDTARCTWANKGECGGLLFDEYSLTNGGITAEGLDSGDDDTFDISSADVAKLHETCQKEVVDSGSVP